MTYVTRSPIHEMEGGEMGGLGVRTLTDFILGTVRGRLAIPVVHGHRAVGEDAVCRWRGNKKRASESIGKVSPALRFATY